MVSLPIGAHEQISLRYKPDFVSELFAVLLSWDVSCGEKMGLLASLSPCHCSYLPVCMISSVMFSVYAELMLLHKITRVYKTSVSVSQAMSIRKTEWLIVVEIVYCENHLKPKRTRCGQYAEFLRPKQVVQVGLNILK